MDAFSELIRLTRECGQLAVKRRQEDDVTATLKKDKSWVSNVDKELSEILVREIRKLFPGDQIISEESSPENKVINPQKHQWYIDPIDGTSGFLKGTNGWAIQIGRVENSRPTCGLVYQGDSDQLFYAQKGQGAFFESHGEKQSLNLKNSPAKTFQDSVYTQSPNYADPEMLEIFHRWGVTQGFKQGSLGMKIMVILLQKADFFLNTGGKTKYWDLAGPEAIFNEAGGLIWNAQAQEFLYNDHSFNFEKPYVCFLAAQSELLKDNVGSLETI